ncbi:MAG: hypothetical protein ABI600_16690 [Luteolibacter sp.]
MSNIIEKMGHGFALDSRTGTSYARAETKKRLSIFAGCPRFLMHWAGQDKGKLNPENAALIYRFP